MERALCFTQYFKGNERIWTSFEEDFCENIPINTNMPFQSKSYKGKANEIAATHCSYQRKEKVGIRIFWWKFGAFLLNLVIMNLMWYQWESKFEGCNSVGELNWPKLVLTVIG